MGGGATFIAVRDFWTLSEISKFPLDIKLRFP